MMNMLIKAGDCITVYQDPLTRTRSEGSAIVLRVHGSTDIGTGVVFDCDVRFAAEPGAGPYRRQIFIEHELETREMKP